MVTVRTLILKCVEANKNDRPIIPRLRTKFSEQHMDYLISSDTFKDWAHLSLIQRARMFHRTFPSFQVKWIILKWNIYVDYSLLVEYKSLFSSWPCASGSAAVCHILPSVCEDDAKDWNKRSVSLLTVENVQESRYQTFSHWDSDTLPHCRLSHGPSWNWLIQEDLIEWGLKD